MMRRLADLLLALAIAGAVGCQRAEDRRIERRVAPADLVGTWYITSGGLEGLRYGGHKTDLDPANHRVVLNADQTCSYASVREPCLHAFPDEAGRIPEGTPCTWRLSEASGYQQVEIGFGPPLQPTSVQSLLVTEEARQLHLFFFVCDPDAWKYIEFTRTPGGA